MVRGNKEVEWGFERKDSRELKTKNNNRGKHNKVKNSRLNLVIMSKVNGATSAKIIINWGPKEKYGSNRVVIQDFEVRGI
jgi:hypothetical protein